MDLPLLDGLADPTIFDDPKVETDLFSTTSPSADPNCFFLSDDPFGDDTTTTSDHIHQHSSTHPHHSNPLSLHPLDTTESPLPSNSSSTPPDLNLTISIKTTTPATDVSKPELMLDPFESPTMPIVSSNPPPAPPSPPLQENQPSNTTVIQKYQMKPRATLGIPLKKNEKKDAPLSPEARNKEKLAQRKLRNKESARRYREKQVARRRQLENFTRTLTEQNRELESLHDRLLTLTCERRVSGIDLTQPHSHPALQQQIHSHNLGPQQDSMHHRNVL